MLIAEVSSTKILRSLGVFSFVLYLGLFGGILFLLPLGVLSLGLAVTTGIVIVFLMSLMLWRNSASYAEDGARLSSKQRLHGLDEYVRMVEDKKETEV